MFLSVEEGANTAIHSQVLLHLRIYFGAFLIFIYNREGTSRYQPSSGSAPAPNTGGDPFTGTSRYQPATNTSVPSRTGGDDPFTGASRYQPAPAPSTQSGHLDPFTGANRYQPSPSPVFTPAPSSPTPPIQSSGNVIPHVGSNARSWRIPAQFLWI